MVMIMLLRMASWVHELKKHEHEMTAKIMISDAPILVKYHISALSAQKSNYQYRLKFSRYFRCIHNSTSKYKKIVNFKKENRDPENTT